MQISKRDKIAITIIAILGILIVSGIIGFGVQDNSWYGMQLDNMTEENITSYNLNSLDAGVVVKKVGGKARRSGIQEGDLITGVNGKPVNDVTSFLSAARSAEKGNDIALSVKRNDQQRIILLGGSPEASRGSAKPVGFTSDNAEPFFLVGGINPQGGSNTPGTAVQRQRTPTEGSWLGMEIEAITPGTIRELNLPSKQSGIIVDSAPVGSIGQNAGLINGDIITSINGQTIVNMADYLRATNKQKITSADLEILRNGQRLYIMIPPEGRGNNNLSPTRPMTNVNPGNGGNQGTWNTVPSVVNPLNTNVVPPITLDSAMPHGYRGVCSKCHQIVENVTSLNQPQNQRMGNTSRLSAELLTPKQQNAAHKVLVEGHWLGMELIPITPELAREYGLAWNIDGLLVDEVTLEAAESGLLAGDVLQSIDNFPVKTLEDFALMTRKVESSKEADLGVLRNGKPEIIRLRSSWDRLGIAQNEAAQPIQPGALAPHQDRGRPCTDCHIIMRSGGQLAIDSGDILPDPPPISKNVSAPHPYRGICNACHQIMQ